MVSYSRVSVVEEDGFADVYCLSVPSTGNFVANGIVVRNCDALRYAVASAFPSGELSNQDENLTIDQIRRNVYGDDSLGIFNQSGGSGGYF